MNQPSAQQRFEGVAGGYIDRPCRAARTGDVDKKSAKEDTRPKSISPDKKRRERKNRQHGAQRWRRHSASIERRSKNLGQRIHPLTN